MIILLHAIFIIAGIWPGKILSSEYAICLAIGLLTDIEFCKALLKK